MFTPAHDQLYYCGTGYSITGMLMRVNSDGTGRTILLTGFVDPRGLEADWANNHLYFVDRGTGTILRVNTDGTNVQTLVTGADRLERLALDLVNGKIYFGNSTQKTIERSNLDGSNRQTVLGAPHVETPTGIALDIAAGKMYWTDLGLSTNYVARANIDGSNVEVLFRDSQASPGLMDIDIDPVSGRIYWADKLGTNEHGWWLANLDGSGAIRIRRSYRGQNPRAFATTLLVSVDPNEPLECYRGNVNLGATPLTDVLFVNGSVGDTTRRVPVTDGQPIVATVSLPPSGGNGRFVIHGILGRASETGVTPLPRGIGNTCFPLLLSQGATPVIIANSAGQPGLVGASQFFGTPTPNPTRAPSTILQRTSDPNLPPGTVVSLQGAIYDPGSSSSRGVSVTNLVTMVVQ